MLLLADGQRVKEIPELSGEQMVDIALALSGESGNAITLPDTVLGCCFWLLSAAESDPHRSGLW